MSRTCVAASTQYLDTANSIVSAPPFTIAGWFKPVSAGAIYELATIESASGATKYLGILQLFNGAVRAASFDGSTTGVATAYGTYGAGAWAHGAGVFTSTADRVAFMNGIAGSRDTTSVPTPTVGVFNVGRLFNSGGAASQYLDGDAAHVAIWNVALTTEEIAMLALGLSPALIRAASLVGYWPLAGVASPETDASTGGHTLTVHGATAGTSPTTYAPSASTTEIFIAGAEAQTRVRIPSLQVRDEIGQSCSCTFRIDGAAPAAGNDVRVVSVDSTSTARIVFGGVITRVSQVYEGKKANLAYDVECGDYRYFVNRRRPIVLYASQSATTIAQSLMSSFTSGMSSVNVQSALASVAVSFDGSIDLSGALTQLATMIGGYWYLDYAKDLHFFTSEATGTPDTLDGTGSSLQLTPPVTLDTDLTQIRTRTIVEGASSQSLAAVPLSGTIIPVQTASIFNTAGGAARVGAQRVTYTGVSAGGAIGTPVGTWALSTTGAPGSLPNNTTFTYKITYYTAAGETTVSAASAGQSSGPTGLGILAAFTPTAGTVPTNISGYAMYVSISTSAGAGPWVLMNTNTPGNASVMSQLAGGSVSLQHLVVNDGAASPPSTNTAGNDEMGGSTTSGSTAIGATSITVLERGKFSATGGSTVVTVNGTPFVVTYTGRNGSYGTGSLTGVPASGFGSVLYTIATGTAIQNAPSLSGVSGLLYPILAGDAVAISVTRNDATAQTALAALEGGDGIHEYVLRDSALLSDATCTARGDADLALFKSVLQTIRYVTLDPKTRSGKTLTVSLPSPQSISGTFKIVRVSIAMIDLGGGRTEPRFTVEASTTRYSLEDLLRQLKKAA